MIRRLAARALALPLVILAAATAGSPAAAAQFTASAEAGVTRVHYSGDEPFALLAFSPFIQLEQAAGWLAAAGTISAFEGGGWGLQGTLAGSRYLPPVLGLRPELSGVAEASRGDDATRAGEAAGRVRMHWLAGEYGVWGGAAAGLADGLTGTRGVRSVEVGAWIRREPLTVVLTVEPEWVGDFARTVDTEGLVRVVRGPLEVSLFGGFRTLDSPDFDTERWGGLTGAWWFSRHIAATVGVGSYPTDLARDFGAGRYTTIALRVANRRPDPPERVDQPVYRLLPPLAEPVVAAFAVEPGAAPDRRRVVVSAPGAQGVELMGDFTDWRPIALRAVGGGRWEADVELGPGVHRLNVRVAGGVWGVPPGVPVVRDDFSGVVGLLTIP